MRQTIDWIKKCLTVVFADRNFADMTVERIGEDYGFASQIYRATWQHDGRSESVVAKIWPFKDENQLAELRFYQAFSEPTIRMPEYVYGEANQSVQQAILVLEDVAGGIQGDVLEQPSSAQIDALIKNLAKWHAQTINHAILAEADWVADFTVWQPEISWIESRRAEFLDRFPKRLNAAASRLLSQLEKAPAVAHQLRQGSPICLLHGDFHLDNILFLPHSEPIFLDWSRPGKGSPAYNLMQLLMFMAPLEQYDPLLVAYLNAFNHMARQPIDRVHLEHWLAGEFLRTFTTSTCGMARWKPTHERGQQIIEDNIDKINAAADFFSTSQTLYALISVESGGIDSF